jgi:type VI secretion system protein VasD
MGVYCISAWQRAILMQNQTDSENLDPQKPSASSRRSLLRAAAFAPVALAGFFSLAACTTSGGGGAAPLPDPAAAAAAAAPRSLQITISASADINPGPSGKAAPLSITLYVLRSPGKFQSLDYFALKDRGSSELASDLVTSSSVSVRPGEKKTVSLTASPDAGYIGVAARHRRDGQF